MKTLILDSSTKKLYCALLIDENVVYEEYVEGKNDHAKNIVAKVWEALKSGNIAVSELDEVICGIGPGSYTGVRMACTVCKMFAIFQNVKLYTISTLELMSSGSKGKVLACIDARRGNAFAGIYNTSTEKFILEEGLYSFAYLNDLEYDVQVNEDNFIVDPIYCLKHKLSVEEPHLLTPNYLRETEAERNLNA